MPEISIVIPLYNKESYIEKSLSSVLNQTYNNFEVVIIDDGSTDNSVEIIKNKFQSEKIRIIKQKNGGPSAARNKGIVEAHSDWIVFLDADDLLLPWTLEYFSYLIKKQKEINYFVCNYFISDGNIFKLASNRRINKIIKKPFMLEFFGDLTERAGASIIKKSILTNYLFDETLRRYEDAEWLYRILKKEKVYMSSVPVTIYNIGSACASNIRKNFNEDFLSHLNFDNKSFWEQMMLYKLAMEAKQSYKEKAISLYSHIYPIKKYSFMYRIGYFYTFYKTIYNKYFSKHIINVNDYKPKDLK